MNIKPLAAAVSLLVAAGTVSAGEIYSSDDNKVELKGWAKAITESVDTDKKDDDGKELDRQLNVFTDAHLKIIGTHTLDEKSKVKGSYAINAGNSKSGDDKTAKFGGIKVEYDHEDLGNFSVGDTGNSFGAVDKAKSGKGTNLYMVSQGGVDGQGLRYKNTFDDVEFSANYETDSEAGHDSNYATSLNYKGESFSAAVSYGSDGNSSHSTGVGADYTVGDLKLGAAFIRFEDASSLKAMDSVDVSLDEPNEGKTYSVAATYTMDDVTLYGSVQYGDGELQGTDVEARTAYVGVDYEVTSSLKTSLVYQTGTVEEEGSDKLNGNFVKFEAQYSF